LWQVTHKHRNVGSSFEEFLKEEGLFDEVDEVAVKRVLAWQIAQEMRRRRVSKSAMAAARRSSRTAATGLD
jgi:hypothetical protein